MLCLVALVGCGGVSIDDSNSSHQGEAGKDSGYEGSAGESSIVADGGRELGDADAQPVDGAANITVRQATVVSIAINPALVTVFTSFPSSVRVDALLSDGSYQDVTSQVTWTSSNSLIVSVSADGELVGLTPGSVTITAVLGRLQSTATVSVGGQMLQRLTLLARPPVVGPGDVVAFELDGIYGEGFPSNVSIGATFESSNPAVVQISDKGSGIALAPGTVTISAKLGAIAVATVGVAVTSATLLRLDVSPSPLTLGFPIKAQLTVTAIYSDQAKFDVTAFAAYSTLDSGVVRVDGGGGVTPIGLGAATATATFSKIAQDVAVTVTTGSPTSLFVIPDPITIANYETHPMSATLMYTTEDILDVTGQATWVVDNPAIASFIAGPGFEGSFIGAHPGSTQIRAKLGGLTSGDVSVTVRPVALLAIDLRTPISSSRPVPPSTG